MGRRSRDSSGGVYGLSRAINAFFSSSVHSISSSLSCSASGFGTEVVDVVGVATFRLVSSVDGPALISVDRLLDAFAGLGLHDSVFTLSTSCRLHVQNDSW